MNDSQDGAGDPDSFLAVPTLSGDIVTLLPLAMEHSEALAEAVAEDDLYKVWYTRLPSPEGMDRDIADRLSQHADGAKVPWVIIRNEDARPVGMTTFLNIRPDTRRLEIGSTWIAASCHGTAVNPESKLLLMRHAFETLDCIAVEFRTHWHNRRSRRAIEGLGAKQDGVLRNNDLWRDGTRRDTVVFSILDSEWPTVRLGLNERLARFGRQGSSSDGS
ncbi:MAG: GNAT family protein [Microthrixaceae bacterium]